MDTFVLRIQLGNHAMETAENVAEALRHVADQIEATGELAGRVRDANGNTVGSYEVQ